MGFGSLTGEFWFGLNALHCLTSQGQWELRIDLKLTNGTIIYVSVMEEYKKYPKINSINRLWEYLDSVGDIKVAAWA